MPEIGLGIFRPLYYSPDLLFCWRAGWAGGAFSRASSAWYIGPDGRIYQAASHVHRIEWYDLDGDGVRETPTTLLEPAATNLLLDSCNLPASGSAWAPTSDFAVSAATSIFQGQTAWRHQNLGQTMFAYRPQAVGTLTGQPETASVIMERVDASETRLSIYDNTLGVHVAQARLDWATGTATVSTGAGTARARKLANAGPNGGPVYRLSITGTGTAGNQRQIRLYPTGASQNTQAAIIHHVQHEVGAVATSPIVTTTAAVTRARDVLTFPWGYAPQAMTGYLRLMCLTVATGSLQTLFQIGNGSADPRLTVLISSAGRPRCDYRRSGTEVASSEAGTGQVNFGNLLEVLWRLRQDGRVQIEHSIDHAPPIVANVSSAAPVLAAAWSGQIAGLSARPVTFDFPAPAAWLDAVVLKGSEWTWDDLRSIVGA